MEYVRFAPRRDTGERRPVIVSVMSRRDAKFWHDYVQPAIARSPARADARWHWPAFRFWLPKLLITQGQRVVGYCVKVISELDLALPVAMVLLVERYPIFRPDDDRTFLWFMSAAAPREALEPFEPGPALALGRVLVDIAIVTAFNLGYEGRIALHAAPAGGEGLLERYEKSYQLLRFSPERAFARPLLTRFFGAVGGGRRQRQNDGRYFYTDEARAKVLAQELDPWRQS